MNCASLLRHHRRLPLPLFCLAALAASVTLSVSHTLGGVPYRIPFIATDDAPLRLTVPRLVGLAYSEDMSLPADSPRGKNDLSAFAVSVTYVSTEDTTPARTILAQQPPAGIALRPHPDGSPCPLHLTVSLGRAAAAVPELAGKSLRDAEISLRDNHFSYTVRQTAAAAPYVPRETCAERSDPAPSDPQSQALTLTVIRTEPPAGTLLPPGSSVVLCVEVPYAPQSALCPSLSGLTEAQAAAVLAQRGLRIGQINEKESTDAPAGTVIEQDRLPDTWLPPGSAVSITLARPTPPPFFPRALWELLHRP